MPHSLLLNKLETVKAVGKTNELPVALDADENAAAAAADLKLMNVGLALKETPLRTATLSLLSTILSLTSWESSFRWAKRSSLMHC